MKILIACEFSGIVREAFRLRGHDAWSCDLLPSEISGRHHIGNVEDILHHDWDMIIGHPPCTYLCNSGVRWLHTVPGRFDKMFLASEFFYKLWNSGIEKICIENPIPHKQAMLPNYSQIIQPWQFGHGETKATCLWLKNLPKLISTNIVDGREARVHKMPPSNHRAKDRSRTYQGIANAMSEQWNF